MEMLYQCQSDISLSDNDNLPLEQSFIISDNKFELSEERETWEEIGTLFPLAV